MTAMYGSIRRVGRQPAALVLLVALGSGCTGGIDLGGGNNNGGATPDGLRVSFTAEGGHFAVGEDDQGNEYAFRATSTSAGGMVLTEANVRTASGQTLKASMDSQGRPVNYRLSNNVNADIAYQGDMAMIRLTDAEGNAAEGRAWRLTPASAAQNLPGAAQTNPTANTTLLRTGLSTYAERTAYLFDERSNPDSPLSGSELESAALLIARVATDLDVYEVDAAVLVNATLDRIPADIQRLAGQTFVLFDAGGLCLARTGVANRLTFDLNGVLQSEFDRNVVFPDFGLGRTRDSGVTINYAAGTPVILSPGESEFRVQVTPVFTGTQLDHRGFITIERRFEAESEYNVQTFAGPTTATSSQLFDAALTQGTLDAEGIVLEFELLLVDLLGENPVRRSGILRYHNQNAAPPPAQFDCEVVNAYAQSLSGINCPSRAALWTPFSASYVFSREDEGRELTFDWFVSGGLGFVTGSPFESGVSVLPVGPGVLEISVIVSDPSVDGTGNDRQYVCETVVGDVLEQNVDPSLLSVSCPVGINVGDTGVFRALGPLASALDLPEWFVLGSRGYFISAPYSLQTEIQFFQPGRFQLGYSGFDEFGEELFAVCEVVVGGAGYDVCAVNGYYGDGICDEFCARADEDCGNGFFDFCEINGFYGDGICDPFCLFADDDCNGGFDDFCAVDGFYGDGICDLFCPVHDPDCDRFDLCQAYGWYGDGICDFCPQPDPDCAQVADICAQQGWYGDGECDLFCPVPDPDCQVLDICLLYGFYADGECDVFCRLPDPDCAGVTDPCALNGYYGDGVCDDDCDMHDPDCPDLCFTLGLYGDGFCDSTCLYPDPDCDEIDLCEALDYYDDGVCDDFCLFPDPDCF